MRWSTGRWSIAALLVAAPWLNPFTHGPSAAVQPWLVSAACMLLLACTAPWSGSRSLASVAVASLAVVASAWLAHSSGRSDLLYLAGGLGLILLTAAVANDVILRDSLPIGLLVAAVLSAVFGLLQYFGASAAFAPWVNFAPSGEAYANLRQTNQYATLCWLGLAVVVCSLPRIPWAAAVTCAVLLSVASAASVSRTGLLQGMTLAALVVLWPAPDRRRRLAICAMAAIGYAAASILLPLLFETLLDAVPSRTLWGRIAGGETCHSRTVLWSNVLRLISQRPWFGWGWGGLDEAHFITLYPGARFCEILDNAHNLPLHLAVELGVPVAALVTICALAWVARARLWREKDAQRQLGWAILGLVAIHSLLEYPLWYGPFQIICGAALGWLLVPHASPREHGRSLVMTRLVAGVLLVATAAVAWDYWRVSQIYLPPDQRRALWRDDPLKEARRSWAFSPQAGFAELTLTPVTRSNAAHMAELGRDMLRYSPEPRTVERLIEAETMMGHDRDAVAMAARYRAAFPEDYAKWREALRIGRDPAAGHAQD